MRKQYPTPSLACQANIKMLIILENSKNEYEQRPDIIKKMVESELNKIIAHTMKKKQG